MMDYVILPVTVIPISHYHSHIVHMQVLKCIQQILIFEWELPDCIATLREFN